MKNYDKLKNNLSNWTKNNRSKLFKFGFYEKTLISDLNLANFNGANSMLRITKDYENANPSIKYIGVESIDLMRLDEFVEKEEIGHIDIVKIDVEGVERQVLEGGKNTFINKVDVVMLEISFVRSSRALGEHIQLFKIMHEYGFAPAKIYDLAHHNNDGNFKLAQFDCIFKKIK